MSVVVIITVTSLIRHIYNKNIFNFLYFWENPQYFNTEFFYPKDISKQKVHWYSNNAFFLSVQGLYSQHLIFFVSYELTQ